MSGLVDPALDIFICSSIFVGDASQVDKLLHRVVQVFVVECDGVLFLVVYSHHLRLLGVDIEARLLSFFGEAGQLLLCVLMSVWEEANVVSEVQVLQLFGESPLDAGLFVCCCLLHNPVDYQKEDGRRQ